MGSKQGVDLVYQKEFEGLTKIQVEKEYKMLMEKV